MTRRRKVLLGGAAAALLVVGVVLGWWFRGPPKGARRLLKFLAQFDPKPATQKDWQALSVKQSRATISGIEMPVVRVQGVRPLLEAELDTSARHLAVVNTRKANELKTVIWSNKANKALEFDWKKGRVREVKKPPRDTAFYLGPESVPAVSKYAHYDDDGFQIGTGGENTYISIYCKRTGEKRIPWERPSRLMTSYYFKKYRYAVCLERDQRNYPKRIVGVAIIDLEKLDLAGLVPLPPQVGSYAPLLVLDPTTDLLLCFDLDIAWVVCIDLRAGIDPAKKPWPPPWPHPALGPWHGNDDVMAGRTTQLPQGTPIPPKPANYP